MSAVTEQGENRLGIACCRHCTTDQVTVCPDAETGHATPCRFGCATPGENREEQNHG